MSDRIITYDIGGGALPHPLACATCGTALPDPCYGVVGLRGLFCSAACVPQSVTT